jgi:hypothetical protein
MRIETITFVYNEEFLIPFYLKHYDFVDQFNICYDIRSTDRSKKILEENKKVNLIPVNFPGGWNTMIRQLLIHDVYDTIKDSWVLNIDCDEFAFMDTAPTEGSNIYRIDFYNVFRHVTETDLDINISVCQQRSHGYLDSLYSKPILIKSGQVLSWTPGNHFLTNPAINQVDIPVYCRGAHWENADLSFCLKRRIKNRRDIQSAYNRRMNFGIHNHNITEEQIVLKCKEHSNDPKIW